MAKRMFNRRRPPSMGEEIPFLPNYLSRPQPRRVPLRLLVLFGIALGLALAFLLHDSFLSAIR